MLKIQKKLLLLRFCSECKRVLQGHAKIYNGLLTGVWKVSEGNSKRAEAVIGEWYHRTQNCIPDSSMNRLIDKVLNCDPNGRILIAKSILSAAKKAGIEKEDSDFLILTEKNMLAYTEWNGNELYEGDKVKVISPAWYQNGNIIEQGHCEINEMGET